MENADLCIIGAGYAGVNVLNAACPHLPCGARIVVVDRGSRFGGQWSDQYDYVRLHQPYENFTAHDREWAIANTKPAGHLASKTEILSHFEDIAAACVAERSIELVTLFSYEYTGHAIEDGKVALTVTPIGTLEASGAAPVSIIATHLFRAEGFNVTIKAPFALSVPSTPTGSATRVHSLCPADVLTPQWSSLMRYSLPDTPIFVIGSGKTAMDVIYHLCKREKRAASRLHCVAGRGTWFMNRDVVFPAEWAETHKLSTRTGTDYFLDMLDLWDGTNTAEVYAKASEAGFLHSPIPGPRNFILGLLSEEESDVVAAALTPAKERIIKGHLVDIVDDTGDQSTLRMVLQTLDGEQYSKEVPSGSFVINATDHITEATNEFQPILSDDGLVCCPQRLCGFTGPSANHVTQAFYTGTLAGNWERLPRINFDVDAKDKAGVEMMFLLVVSSFLFVNNIPRDVKSGNRQANTGKYPFYRMFFTGMRLKKVFPDLIRKMGKLMPLRYTDKEPYSAPSESSMGVLGGRVGQQRSNGDSTRPVAML